MLFFVVPEHNSGGQVKSVDSCTDSQVKSEDSCTDSQVKSEGLVITYFCLSTGLDTQASHFS